MTEKSLDMDIIAKQLVLEDDLEKKKELAKKIINLSNKKGIFLSSVNDFYMARGRNEISGFTVPAMNLRTMTYDLSKAIFRVAKKLNSQAFIFEIAKSEMGYTHQPPVEYSAVILAAAIKEGYQGPVFIQGDHFQVNAKKYLENPQKELKILKDFMIESVENGFYNIDIDSSTLVDLSKQDIKEQQLNNYKVCAELTNFIRKIQPKELMISIGGEIGEVGHKNSTPEDLNAFMEGFKENIPKDMVGISKISIQTGTTHGGVILADGTIAKVKLDFDTLKIISSLARKEHGMAGAVQHGASTLPDDAFNKFPQTETAEVHLATQFQNMILESKHFPKDLKAKINNWVKTNCIKEKKEQDTEDQFIYKLRKKAMGPFKKDIMNLPAEIRNRISQELEEKFEFLFRQLNVVGTKDMVSKYVKLVKVEAIERNSRKVEMDGEGDD